MKRGMKVFRLILILMICLLSPVGLSDSAQAADPTTRQEESETAGGPGEVQERAIPQIGGTGGTNLVSCPDCTCEHVSTGFWVCTTKDGKKYWCTDKGKTCEEAPFRESLPVDLVPVNPQPQLPYCPTFSGRTLIVTVRNNSTTIGAPSTVTRLQLSTFYNATLATPAVAPGGSVNLSFPFPTNPPPGDWIPTVTVDAGNQVVEGNEKNNVLTGKCTR